MDFNEYVLRTRETVIYAPEVALHYLIPGLLVEAVELLNATMADVPKESGDCLYFSVRILDTLNLGMPESVKPARGGAASVVTLAAACCDAWVKAVRDNGSVLSPFQLACIGADISNLLACLAGIAALYNLTLSDIMQANVDKLADRKARGVLSGSGNER